MTNLKISQLTDGGALQATDEVPVERSGSNFKVAGSEFGGSLPFDGGTSPLGYVSAFQLFVDGGELDGGSYTLNFRGQVTAAIAWNEDPGAKLEALANIGAGNVGTFGPGSLPDRTLVFFLGDLATDEIVVGVDVTIASQALTFASNPVTLQILQWETGDEPVAGATVVEARVETDSTLGIRLLWVNVGTVLAPDWQPVNGLYAYEDEPRVAGSSVTVDRSSVQIAALADGQIRADLIVSVGDGVAISVLDGLGNELNALVIDANGITAPYLPTSDPGGSGRLWNDSGAVMVT